MNEAAYVGATSITPGPRLIGAALLAAACQLMTWRADSPAACWWVDGDVVPPTSLNEGRGEVFPALEVLCWSYGKNGERDPGSPMWKGAKCGKVGTGAILGRARNGISHGVQQLWWCRGQAVLQR